VKHRLLILLVCAASLNFAQDLESRARTAVAQKRFNDGLALYKTLLAGNPTSVDYMLWMGRLSAWTGEYTGAVEYYSQALASQPANIDALVGKANALMWKNSYREALVVLTQARELAPLNAEVELAWSRYYHWQGDDKNAKLHLAKSLAFNADNQEALQLKESLSPSHTIELRFAYEGDTLAGTTPGAIEELDASYINRNGEVGVDFAHLNRFGEGGSRGGAHFSRNVDHVTSVRGAFLFGDGGDIVARWDLAVGVSRKMGHGWVLGADYRYIAFRPVKINSVIGSLDYYFEKPIWIQTSVAANHAEGALTPAFLVRFNAQVRKNLTMNVGYGHGTEVFQLALPTTFYDFRRDSFISGLSLAVSKKTRLETTYSFSRRSTGVFENMFLVAVVHTL
jgi:YaiO family outer membrane protein